MQDQHVVFNALQEKYLSKFEQPTCSTTKNQNPKTMTNSQVLANQ
jgi:hypothetical protein